MGDRRQPIQQLAVMPAVSGSFNRSTIHPGNEVSAVKVLDRVHQSDSSLNDLRAEGTLVF